MKYLLAVLLTLSSITIVIAQNNYLSNNATISVITFGPGKHLSDAFGHNAFRVKDTSQNLDLVFGYGGYNFNTPNFYIKFAKGQLNYHITKNNFLDVYNYYSSVNRSIKQQTLHLTQTQKQTLYNTLVNHYKPENRNYQYDFFFNNCATKIRDVVTNVQNGTVNFNTTNTKVLPTYRQLIHQYVGLNTWGSLGIDIALGSKTDQRATVYQQMFLPDYIHHYFSKASKKDGRNLVNKFQTLYHSNTEKTTFNPLSPLVICTLLSIIIIYITYRNYKTNTFTFALDAAIAISTTLIGIVILFLWFGTNHSVTSYNYNLLWAFPLNLITLLPLKRSNQKPWVKGYFKFLILMLCLMLLHWTIGVQTFALPLAPLLLALLIRYTFLAKHVSVPTS